MWTVFIFRAINSEIIGKSDSTDGDKTYLNVPNNCLNILQSFQNENSEVVTSGVWPVSNSQKALPASTIAS